MTKYGWAHIFVLKPDEDMANVLKSATRLLINPKDHRNAVVTGDLTEKEIEYNGRQAYLVEIKEKLMDGFVDYRDYAAIAFFLDGKVCVIDAFTTDNFGMSAWDIIDSITVTS